MEHQILRNIKFTPTHSFSLGSLVDLVALEWFGGGRLSFPPAETAPQGRSDPEEEVGEIDPDGVLHARDAGIALGVFADVHLAEDAEQGEPEEDEDALPDEDWQMQRRTDRDRAVLEHEGSEQVGQSREGGQTGRDLGVHPFGVRVGVRLVRVVEVNSVEAGDGQAHDELEEA